MWVKSNLTMLNNIDDHVGHWLQSYVQLKRRWRATLAWAWANAGVQLRMECGWSASNHLNEERGTDLMRPASEERALTFLYNTINEELESKVCEWGAMKAPCYETPQGM